ncbi:LysR substrate-binding domain-containing protein [Photobacterium makurazakiensis]|uniref:LysR substrate-binding domain-containing protein n=1 Tax=Photobacterium makurazakiensis TaxID=2910234 RepID=UPI003D0C7053
MSRVERVIQRSLPPFNSLRAFESAARHLSLTRAAEELSVSRGAISQQIKLLEEYLNEALFIRQGSSLTLTDQAINYLPLLTETFNNLQVGTQSLFGKNVSHTLTIRISQSFCCAWLLTRLADFQRQNPNLKIKFYSTVNLYPSTNQSVDIEIINGYGNWQGKDAERITNNERWVVVASPSYLKQYDFNQSIEAISSYPKIATMGYSEGWRDWFNLHSPGMPFTDPELEFDSTKISMEAACQGLGMLLAKTILVEDALKAGDLVIAHPATLDSQSNHYIIVNRNRDNQYKVAQFKNWLRKSIN